MAEQVNQRIEDMINEFEQMRRTSLYNEEEIKEISRKRKEYEYHIQRHVKQKEDYVQYIAYEMALLEDISRRRKEANLTGKKREIEFAIAKHLNKVFKQLIYRFQNELDVYLEYLKFCKSVGFLAAASGILAQMLQMHSDKPEVWLLASKWENEEQKDVEAARSFLLKGLQRHPDAEVLYMELFKAELLMITFNAESDEEKEKLLKRADIVWRNGLMNVDDVGFLFKCLDLILKYELEGDMKNSIKANIWDRKDKKEVWPYIAEKELGGCHWEEIEAFVTKDAKYPEVVSYCIGVYEEALTMFPGEYICTKYIHTLLGLNNSVFEDSLKISAVKKAWMSGYKNDLLTHDMFDFGIKMLKFEGETSDEEMWKLLDVVSEKYSKLRCIWVEKLLLSTSDEGRMTKLLEDAVKVLEAEDAVYLYNLMLDNMPSNVLKNLLKKFHECENTVLLSIKPKLLQKVYDQSGLKAARDFYQELIRIPPVQLEVNTVMISIESLQEKPDVKQIRKIYECAILSHGSLNTDIWNDYIEFEIVTGNPTAAPEIYRRALSALTPLLIVDFIDKQAMHRTN